MQPVLQRRWQRHVVLLFLGLAVLAVAMLSIKESEPDHGNVAPKAVSRTISESSTPDLSTAGFRIGSLAVSLVSDLFSGTQLLLKSPINGEATTTSASTTSASTTETTQNLGSISGISTTSYPSTTSIFRSPVAPTPPTTAAVPSANETETSYANSTTSTTPTTAVRVIATTVPSSTTAPPTAPISEEPTEESFEPDQEMEITIFGQPYLDTWPRLEMWERMAWCESRQTWDVDTGNGYFGGLQFALGSWQWMGGQGSPADAGKEEQIYRANLLWQAQGWNGWPGCKQYFGWSRWQVKE